MMGEVVLLRCGSGGFHGHAMATTVIQKLFLYLYGFGFVRSFDQAHLMRSCAGLDTVTTAASTAFLFEVSCVAGFWFPAVK